MSNTIGPYALGEVFRKEKTGTIFWAQHGQLNRKVLLKVLNPQLNEQAGEAFKQDAQAGATLDHPNLMQIFEVAEADGRFYMAMEAPEASLATILENQGRIEPALALPLMSGLAQGLKFAWEQAHLCHGALDPEHIYYNNAASCTGYSTMNGHSMCCSSCNIKRKSIALMFKA